MKWWKVLTSVAILVIIVLIVLMTTKPERTAHYSAVKSAIAEVVSKELNENPALEQFAAIGTMKALEATDELLTRGLIIHDHTYYNIGLIIYNGQPIPVSIGFLGQIRLTASQQDLEELLKRPDVLEIIGIKELKAVYGL